MAQKVEITSKNLQLGDQIKDYINKKVSRLERILPEVEETRVDLASSKAIRNRKERDIAQFTLIGKGFTLRSEESGSDLMTAIDEAADKMQRQIERFKGKRNRGRGDGISMANISTEPELDEETKSLIVRRKTFTLIPMDENEAIEQMALLSHEDFFIFYNVDTNSINVLYKRRDGDFGLIEPKIG
ncbi:MAG: ribosome-associated translation inhibitor RaiA [Anaerolineaceae bacterium]